MDVVHSSVSRSLGKLNPNILLSAMACSCRQMGTAACLHMVSRRQCVNIITLYLLGSYNAAINAVLVISIT